ncbi:MAG: hypothetical protein JSW27_22060 [Phycisphaerales bacterium]|nr:MAG: hypothetical protein JSW27_22060 [Phycisphaerales bacterium]
MKFIARYIIVATGAVFVSGACASESQQAVDLPESWLQDWNHPPAARRPLQIVHGVPAQQATPEAMTQLKDLGLGGVVANVAFGAYLRSDENWRILEQVVESCKRAGLRVWIYDEDGYPSGAAGGLVLEGHPEFEALALAYDSSRADPFVLRPAYEHTHASNNYYMARRYPNLIDKAAVERFMEVTHDAYYQRLGSHFGTTIEALFTDEPSLMAVNIGPLPDEVRTKVRVADPLDPNVQPLPCVPWVADLPELYRQRHGQDLLAVRESLFTGDTQADRQVRRRYWALVAELLTERYYGRIQQWARAHRVASSGHILWEEMLIHHPALEGNTLQVLGRMDIPGLDLLTSWPEAVIHSGWLTAGLPASAALLNGGRRVMTEVSDFSETMAGKAPASVADMCTTAAWQAALGVTEFTLYYNRGQRTPEQYNAYGTFVGRLNALLREARPAPRVLLYYPIADAWAEYKPVAEKLTAESQAPRLRRIANSFMDLGQRMTRKQISFALADHEVLAGARVDGDRLVVNDLRFSAVALPAEAELPSGAAAVLERFEANGGEVLWEKADMKVDLTRLVRAYDSGILNEPADRLVVGRFTRAEREMLVAVNVATEGCERTILAPEAAKWLVGDPAAGTIEPVRASGQNRITVSLPGRATRVFIGPAKAGDGRTRMAPAAS